MTETALPTDHVVLRSGAPGEVVAHQIADGLGCVTTCVLDPDADLDTIHDWVTQPRASFWGLGDHSREELREVYAFVDSLPTHHAYLLRCNDRPVALLQTYDPADDPVGECYPVQPGDAGAHLLVGEHDPTVPGFATRLMGVLAGFMFSQEGVRRVVVEPDVRNDRALGRMRRMGFDLGPEIDLPTKRAQLAFLTREAWERL